jgi:hypothetical protein
MLWNPDMKLPDVERAEQLKAKQTKKASNQFAAFAKRNKKEKIDQPSAQDDPKVIWKPVLAAYSVPLEKTAVPAWLQRVAAWDLLGIRHEFISC